MTDTDVRSLMGEIGENHIFNLFNGTASSYKYDASKDGMIGELSVQVKTIRLNQKTEGFWLGNNFSKTLWSNLDKVDMLFFVRIPEKPDELARSYLCIDHKNCWTKSYRNDSVAVRNYPLTSCLQVGILSPEDSLFLLENSKMISYFKRAA